MDTYFAPPEKATPTALSAEIEILSGNPVVTGLLHSINGLIAVLDERRQIVALNDAFLQMLGIDDPEEALGLRHGEALACVHAEEDPAGCGTTKFCPSCGAAIAVVSSLEENRPVERICALTRRRGEGTEDLALLVRSHPILIDGQRFLLIFLQDITQQERMAALERTFFHDLGNMLHMLLWSSELLVEKAPSELAAIVHQAAVRLNKEIAMQRCLAQSDADTYTPQWQDVATTQVLAELNAFLSNHPAAHGKGLEVHSDGPQIRFRTDLSLLLRVLSNMAINALEATEAQGRVDVWVEASDERVLFSVWNAQVIPAQTALRIFQRNFSTKEQAGRGVGTFSMKLFGEDILGGRVSFSTSEGEGTVFRFSHPR